MAWLADALRGNPAQALFLVLAVGFALGQVRLGAFQLACIQASCSACAPAPAHRVQHSRPSSERPTARFRPSEMEWGYAVGNVPTALGGTLLVVTGPR
jgi:hypothetical protein